MTATTPARRILGGDTRAELLAQAAVAHAAAVAADGERA